MSPATEEKSWVVTVGPHPSNGSSFEVRARTPQEAAVAAMQRRCGMKRVDSNAKVLHERPDLFGCPAFAVQVWFSFLDCRQYTIVDVSEVA